MLLKPQLQSSGIVWETPRMLTNKSPHAERMEWFVEDQAFLRFHARPPPPLPVSKLYLFISLSVCRRSSLLTGGGGGWKRGRAWSRIIRAQESLGFYKSFNPLCPKGMFHFHFWIIPVKWIIRWWWVIVILYVVLLSCRKNCTLKFKEIFFQLRQKK
jgi:hypothetical protein